MADVHDVINFQNILEDHSVHRVDGEDPLISILTRVEGPRKTFGEYAKRMNKLQLPDELRARRFDDGELKTLRDIIMDHYIIEINSNDVAKTKAKLYHILEGLTYHYERLGFPRHYVHLPPNVQHITGKETLICESAEDIPTSAAYEAAMNICIKRKKVLLGDIMKRIENIKPWFSKLDSTEYVVDIFYDCLEIEHILDHVLDKQNLFLIAPMNDYTKGYKTLVSKYIVNFAFYPCLNKFLHIIREIHMAEENLVEEAKICNILHWYQSIITELRNYKIIEESYARQNIPMHERKRHRLEDCSGMKEKLSKFKSVECLASVYQTLINLYAEASGFVNVLQTGVIIENTVDTFKQDKVELEIAVKNNTSNRFHEENRSSRPLGLEIFRRLNVISESAGYLFVDSKEFEKEFDMIMHFWKSLEFDVLIILINHSINVEVEKIQKFLCTFSEKKLILVGSDLTKWPYENFHMYDDDVEKEEEDS